MTAINVIVTEKIGYLLSDTACYDLETGVVTSWASKVQTYPHSGSAVAVRGPVPSWHWATEICGRVGSCDELFTTAPTLLREDFPRLVEAFGEHDIDVTFIGFSNSERRIKAGIANSPSFELDMGDTLMAPMLSDDERSAAGIELTSDPPADLLKMMQAQRRSLTPEEPQAIGGSAVLTMISMRGISQSVLHVWTGDKIGEIPRS